MHGLAVHVVRCRGRGPTRGRTEVASPAGPARKLPAVRWCPAVRALLAVGRADADRFEERHGHLGQDRRHVWIGRHVPVGSIIEDGHISSSWLSILKGMANMDESLSQFLFTLTSRPDEDPFPMATSATRPVGAGPSTTVIGTASRDQSQQRNTRSSRGCVLCPVDSAHPPVPPNLTSGPAPTKLVGRLRS